MEVTITELRRNLFDLVKQAMDGVEVHVVHRGRGFTLKPDEERQGILSRIRPIKVIRDTLDGADEELLQEMTAAWEKDWAEL